jgi:hypothetical protein
LPHLQTNVEICSVHGVFEEFYVQWLKHGHFVGVHGGGDNHMTSAGWAQPGFHYPNTNGLTGAWMPERTRQALWEALKGRMTYAVTGNQRIFLDARINGYPMGTVVAGERGPRSIQVEVAGTAPILKVELFRNGQLIKSFRPDVSERRVLRLVWWDDWPSRRVDESVTTGSIAAEGVSLKVLRPLNAYTRSDHLAEEGGRIHFRSNAYSGTLRGLWLEPSAVPEAIGFSIHDRQLGREIMNTTLRLPLHAAPTRLTAPMTVPPHHQKPLFTKEPHHPVFTLEADWVNPDGPLTARLDWRDEDAGPAYYWVRVEQADGNRAWSSPVWFLERPSGLRIPGRVVGVRVDGEGGSHGE